MSPPNLRTYLLAPTLSQNPTQSPITLGNLLADPFRPHRILTSLQPLNTSSALYDSAYPPISTSVDLERSLGRTTSSSVSASLWGSFLTSVQSGFELSRSVSSSQDFEMDALETREWLSDPTPEEIRRRISDARVQAFIKGDSMLRRRQPVYMVSGIKIAKNLRVSTSSGKSRSGALQGEIPISTPAGNVGVGAKLGREKGREDRESWYVEGDVVFAYQLLKIEVKGWKERRVHVDEWRNEAAYLGEEDCVDSDEDDEGDDGLLEFVVGNVTAGDLEDLDEPGLVNVDTLQDETLKVEVVSFPKVQ